MMRFSVLIHEDGHIARDYHIDGLSHLQEKGKVDIFVIKGGQETKALDRFFSNLKEVDAAVIGPWYHPPMKLEHWKQAINLKVFAGTFDNRFADWGDFYTLNELDVKLIDTSRSMTPSVAEFALAMTLNLIRDIPESLYVVREGNWDERFSEFDILGWKRKRSEIIHGDLTGRRIGLAGFGSINRRYTELIAPFKCEVLVYDPFTNDNVFSHYGVKRADSLVELARSSEIFIVGIPPLPTTKEIINRDVIYSLPKGSLFVLVTRMAVVEQKPLWERIKINEIAAAIDVFEPEPPPADAWFRKHPNVQATPHIAGGTEFCHSRCFAEACKDAISILNGEKPKFEATKRDYLLYEGKLDPSV